MEIRIQEYEYYLLPAADLEKEIDRLNEDLQNERTQHMYTLAEFNNYRRQVEQNKNQLLGEAKRKLLLPLLDVINGLGNALQWPVDNEQTLKKSVYIAHQKLLLFLESQRFVPLQRTNSSKILLEYTVNDS